MKRVAAILLLIGATTAFASNEKEREAQAILERAWKVMATHERPFHMEGKFIIHAIDGPLSGTFVEDRLSEDRLRKELQIADYSQTQVTNVDRLYVLRTRPLSPSAVQDVLSALVPRLKLPNEHLAKLTDGLVNNEKVRCLNFKTQYYTRVWCFDPTSGVLRSTDAAGFHVEYSDWVQQESGWHPKKVSIRRNNIMEAEAEITKFGPPRDAADVLAVPTGAREYAWCQAPKAPKAIHSPDPQHPPGYKGESGKVVLRVLIDETGHVADAVVSQTAGPFDGAALDTVRRWTFKPATCGDTPIPVEVNVEFNFHGY